jgi:hypothetical protein
MYGAVQYIAARVSIFGVEKSPEANFGGMLLASSREKSNSSQSNFHEAL